MASNLTCFENLESKSCALLKSCFKIWFFPKVLIFFCFDLKLFFSIYSPNHGSWETAKLKKLAFSRGKKYRKKTFCKQIIHHNLFLYKSISLQKLMRCKFFFSKSDTFYNFLFEIVVFYKKRSKSDAFEILDSKHDALYKKRFKNSFFSKNLIQVLFLNENFFSATTFPRMRKKANKDVFTVYNDQLNHFLRANFPKNLDFLTTLFWPKTDAL